MYNIRTEVNRVPRVIKVRSAWVVYRCSNNRNLCRTSSLHTQNAALFFQVLFLCLSRACLGKLIVFR